MKLDQFWSRDYGVRTAVCGPSWPARLSGYAPLTPVPHGRGLFLLGLQLRLLLQLPRCPGDQQQTRSEPITAAV